MNWRTEWNALSARIRGVADAAEFYIRTTAVRSNDMYAVLAHSLLPQTRDIHSMLQSFATMHGDFLPYAAKDCLQQFLSTRPEVFRNSDVDRDGAIQFRITALVAFRSEFDYHISDLAAFARRQSERAFVHLQRSIVVDMDERKKWQAAIEQGEVACERLGAVRLLAHGIWAFKIDGAGERTDLVFQDPLGDNVDMNRSADALVLTEWKVCLSPKEAVTKLTEARVQAMRYRTGVLAGIELASYRYLIIVSRKRLSLPIDESNDEVIYRHVNIAVDPDPPSKSARARM